MIFPLKELIEYGDNMYEITTAASRRAYQLSSVLEKDEKDDYDGKMVALAALQVLPKKSNSVWKLNNPFGNLRYSGISSLWSDSVR